MSAPERIWAWEIKPCIVCRGEWDVLDDDEVEGHAWAKSMIPYVRTDLHTALLANRDRLAAALDAQTADRDRHRDEAIRLAARVEELERERDEWKQAATEHHPNPADFRYWEGRYRDERARADRLAAEVERLRAALQGD